MTRRKPFLTYFGLCALPLLLLAGLNYWNGLHSVDSITGAIVQNDLNAFNVAVDQELRDRKVALFIDHLPEGVWQISYESRA